ncbi:MULTISPECIES: hypothetical protein [unclassified Pseudoalteromonas]|jgi:hypothetical protein|uniref:hypothetical protein n=1 Tax=unclassified Pseudoalteromonas TaxID=194690 RepID=UPI001C4DB755|nr:MULTISPECIES: hypothetical protein [unclassified Pseudoalteromonas]
MFNLTCISGGGVNKYGGFWLTPRKLQRKETVSLETKNVFSILNVEHIEGLHEVLDALRGARNSLAHAKPDRYEYDLGDSEVEFAVFKRPYNELLTIEFLKHANSALNELSYVMGNNEDIEDYGLITSAVEVG